MDLNDNLKEDKELMYVYEWVDNVPLSRQKKNIARDFSDGVLVAELIKYHLPKLVELHNYPPASSSTQKTYNWVTLNHKVFKKLGFQISKQEMQDVIACKPFLIENILRKVYRSIQNYQEDKINQTKNDDSSGEIYKLNSGNNDQLNINNSSPSNDRLYYQNASEVQLRKIIDEKDLKIEEMKNIIDILDLKLKNSEDVQMALEKRIKELNDIIRERASKVN